MVTTDLYRHFDADGRLLYVGVSFGAIARLQQHKKSCWFSDIARVDVEKHPSRKAALDAEAKAILAENPIYNIAGAGGFALTKSEVEAEMLPAGVLALVCGRGFDFHVRDWAAFPDLEPDEDVIWVTA